MENLMPGNWKNTMNQKTEEEEWEGNWRRCHEKLADADESSALGGLTRWYHSSWLHHESYVF